MLEQLLQNGVAPIIAILRGVEPDEAVDIAQVIVDAGIRIIEVPLNSPEALSSIQRLRASLANDVVIGAGTVTDVESVDQVAAAGGQLIVAPNMNPAVIASAVQRGLTVIPGVLTPTEAFAAVQAGARDLKLFPASSVAMTHIKALQDVLPSECRIWAVGGTDATNIAAWLKAGAAGVGVGGALYRRGRSKDDVRSRARTLVQAWQSTGA